MIILCGYRDWAVVAFDAIVRSHSDFVFKVVVTVDELQTVWRKHAAEIEIMYFVGWSWLVPSAMYNASVCLCFHPSQLPRYRGGSPLQHQILDGVDYTSATLFKMNGEIDGGPIWGRYEIDLTGQMSEVFESLSVAATVLLSTSLTKFKSEKTLYFEEQVLEGTQVYKRRTPDQSELTLDELRTMPADYVIRKIRALGDPYPNAFILSADGKKILIKEAIAE